MGLSVLVYVIIRRKAGWWWKVFSWRFFDCQYIWLSPRPLSKIIPSMSVEVITFLVEPRFCHTGLRLWFLLLAVFVEGMPWCPSCSFWSEVARKAKYWKLTVFCKGQYPLILFRMYFSSPLGRFHWDSFASGHLRTKVSCPPTLLPTGSGLC